MGRIGKTGRGEQTDTRHRRCYINPLRRPVPRSPTPAAGLRNGLRPIPQTTDDPLHPPANITLLLHSLTHSFYSSPLFLYL